MGIYDFLVRLGASGGCHQKPERSFFFFGRQFPVCARCMGILIGQILGIVLFVCGLDTPLYADILLLAIMLADWLWQNAGHLSNNPRRLITGMCCGAGEIFLLMKAFSFLLWLRQIA